MNELRDMFTTISSECDDEYPTSIIVLKKQSKFNKLCDSLEQMISLWKEKSVPVTVEECEDALKIIENLKETHAVLQTRTSALSEQIIQLQSQLAAEVRLREKTERELQSQIDQLRASNVSLISSRDEGQRVMLIRALGTSFQYALTQKFPGVFTTKYPYSCTFNDIDKKISAQRNVLYDNTLADVKSFFLTRGIVAADINGLIKTIREVGTASSHVTEMIGADGVAFKPSAADLHGVINSSTLSDTIKEDARVLLEALTSIVPPNGDLLYRI
jgi:hypothetical protein